MGSDFSDSDSRTVDSFEGEVDNLDFEMVDEAPSLEVNDTYGNNINSDTDFQELSPELLSETSIELESEIVTDFDDPAGQYSSDLSDLTSSSDPEDINLHLPEYDSEAKEGEVIEIRTEAVDNDSASETEDDLGVDEIISETDHLESEDEFADLTPESLNDLRTELEETESAYSESDIRNLEQAEQNPGAAKTLTGVMETEQVGDETKIETTKPETDLNRDDQRTEEETEAAEEKSEPFWVEVSRDEIQSKLGKDTLWAEAPFDRGRSYEQLRDANLASNCPVIDDINPDPENLRATSMKTLDLTSDTYQNINQLDSQVKGYIDDLNNFDDITWNGLDVSRNDIEDLYLELAVPAGKGSPEQIENLLELQDYANSKNVTLVVMEVP